MSNLGLPVPAPDICSGAGVSVFCNDEWWPVIVGLLDRGLHNSHWSGTETQLDDARDAILRLSTQECQQMPTFFGMLGYRTPTGVNGGSAVAGNQIRAINYAAGDFVIGDIIGGNGIQPVSGLWRVTGFAACNRVDKHRFSLAIATSTTLAILGASANARSNVAFPGYSISHFSGEINTDGNDIFRGWQYCQTAHATSGLGQNTDDGNDNVYMQMDWERMGDYVAP